MITNYNRILGAVTAFAIGATVNFTPHVAAQTVETNAFTKETVVAQTQTKSAAERREMRRIEREKRRKEREKNRKTRRGPFGGSFS